MNPTGMFKRYPIAVYCTWVLLLVILPAPLVFVLNQGLEVSSSKLVIYDLGVICYVWWLASVGLSARPQWLDRLIGLPELYFIHAGLGVLALIAGSLHALQAHTHKFWVYWTGQIAWILAIFGLLYSVFFLSGWLVERIPVIEAAKQRITRVLTHQVSVWIHRLHFVVIGLVLVHVHVIKQITNVPAFIVGMHLYTWLAIGMYVWAKYIAPHKQIHRGYVVANRPITRDTHQVVIKLDEHAPVYEPGDFYFLSFKGCEAVSGEPHPFSVTFTPEAEGEHLANRPEYLEKLAANTRLLTFTIRELGDFTKHISNIPVDTTVRLEGPFGRFNRVLRDDDPNQRLVLIGMGTGIAPIMSLALGYAHKRPITIFHTVRQEEDFFYVDRFKELATTYPSMVYHHKVHRYSPEMMVELLGEDLTSARYVIVGGASAVLKTNRLLKRLGIPGNQIIDERLTM